MADPFLAEIRLFGFNFPPRGWAFCNGQVLPLAQNTALFSLLGTSYGGNGQSTFALPNLQGRVPRGVGQGPGLSNVDLGEQGGTETVTLTVDEVPFHAHALRGADEPATENDPQNNALALPRTPGMGAFAAGSGGTPMAAVEPAGNGLPHNNLQPSLVLNFCIAMQGIFPPRP
jgi:microcystin-dependent protein